MRRSVAICCKWLCWASVYYTRLVPMYVTTICPSPCMSAKLVYVLAWMHWPLRRALLEGPLWLAALQWKWTIHLESVLRERWGKALFSLAICFTQRAGHRRLWLWAQPNPGSTLQLVLVAMVSWCTTAFHLLLAQTWRWSFDFASTTLLRGHSFAAQAWGI